jgi:hypothetical protein
MYGLAAIVALALGLFAAVWAYGLVGGGFWGFVLGLLAFIATGWLVFIIPPVVMGAFSGSSKSHEAAVRKLSLLEDGDKYLGDVSGVLFFGSESAGSRTMGFFGVSRDAYLIGSTAYGNTKNIRRVDMRRTTFIPQMSVRQQGSWDIRILKADDIDAYDRASVAGDQPAAERACREVATLVLQDGQPMRDFHRLMESQMAMHRDADPENGA